MAINKNFVVKNGIEVNTSLIVADATLNKVGVGTTVPGYTLHVGGSRGGIGATDLTITGIATVGTSGSTSSALSVVGVSTFQGDIILLGSAGVSTISFDASLDKLNFADNARATFGASDDLQIFHDGSNSIIRETGEGNIVLEGSGETLAVFADDGAVSLYYDNTNVFQTTPQGVNVAGVTTSARLNVSGISTLDGGVVIGSATSIFANGNVAFAGLATANGGVQVGTAASIYTNGNIAAAGIVTANGGLAVGAAVTLASNGNAGFTGIVTAKGVIDANGGINASSAKVEDLTDNRIVIAGSSGELEDSANLTFDGAGLVVTGVATVSGAMTAGSFSVGNNQVISSARQLQNIASLDSTTTATIESAIANAPNTFTDLKVTGITTLGFTTATTIQVGNEGLSVAGVTTQTGDLIVGVSTFFVDVSNGGVGVGTDNPNPQTFGPQFKVFGSNPVLTLEDDGGGANAFGFIRQNNNTLEIVTGDNSDNKIQISKTSDTSSSWTGSNLTNIVTVDQGNIGVGIATATIRDSAKLDVDGDARFSGKVAVRDGGNAGAGVTIFDNGNIVASGIITATEFSGPFSGSTGSFSGDLSIADKITHIGDTNTAIRFPAADTFTVETAGSERFRVDSAGLVGIGTDDPDVFAAGADDLVIRTTGDTGITIRSGSTNTGNIFFASADNATSNNGIFQYDQSTKEMRFQNYGGGSEFFTFYAQANERLRITSAGLVGVGTATPRDSSTLDVDGGGRFNGDVSFSGSTGAGSTVLFDQSDNSLKFVDSTKAKFGSGGDLEVYHNGTDSLIDNVGAGDLYIRNQVDDKDIIIQSDNGSGATATYIQCDGSTTAVDIMHGGNIRVSTTADGVDIGGTGSIKIPVGTTAQRNGSPTAGDFRYNSTLGQFEGYTSSWGEIGGSGGGVSETDTSVSTTTATGVGSFAVATHRSASIIAQIDQGGSYQVGRYLMIHDGTTATVIEESAIATGDMLGSFTADVNNSNAELKVTMNSSGIATVTTKIDTVTV